MKRKFFVVLAALLIVLGMNVAFAACKEQKGDGALQMDKKYYYNGNTDEKTFMEYLIFYSNNTGTIRSCRGSEDQYLIHFKYTFIDDEHSTVVCFHDSHEGEDNGLSDWTMTYVVSRNIIKKVDGSSYAYSYYINEDYLKEIPNYDTSIFYAID